jgi:hypothetical protein
MKKAPLVFFASTALALCGFAFQRPVARTFSFVPLSDPRTEVSTQTFTGEIFDGQCSANGSHDAVMKKASVNSPANCARGCAKKHGLVLVVGAGKTVYQLDDLAQALPFAGQKAKVRGRLDKASNTLHVRSVEAAQ